MAGERVIGKESVLNLADAVAPSWANGPGARAVVFVQGCSIGCPGCHNPNTWDPRPVRLCTPAAVMQWYRSHTSLRGVTLSGGEPFEQAELLAEVGRAVHELGGDVVAFSGFSYAQLRDEIRPGARALLDVVDLLIDGPFLRARRTHAPLRGSDNQQLVFLSARIKPEELDGLPRTEWLGYGDGAHVTGFQINRLAKLVSTGRTRPGHVEAIQHEYSGCCDADSSE